jgi:hypothetical protein
VTKGLYKKTRERERKRIEEKKAAQKWLRERRKRGCFKLVRKKKEVIWRFGVVSEARPEGRPLRQKRRKGKGKKRGSEH